MSGSRKIKYIIAIALVSLTFAAQLNAQNNDQLLKNIPADTLLCVRINNFNNSLNQVDKFLTGISPVGVSMLVQAQLPDIIGSPQLSGLNMDGDFAIFGTIFNSQDAQQDLMSNIFVGLFAPVTDYNQFIKGISSKTPADSNGVVRILTLGVPEILLTQCGDYALATLSNEYNNLLKFKKLMNSGSGAAANNATLANVLSASQVKQATSEPFWIYGNIHQASQTFEPFISGMMENIKSSLAAVPNIDAGISPESLQNIMGIYFNILDSILNQVNSVSLSINPTADSLNITNMVTTVPGSEMAKMFASNPSAQPNNLFPYLENGAMMNVAFSLDSALMKNMTDLQFQIISMLSGTSTNNDDIQKMKTMAENMIDCVKGPAVYTFSADTKSKMPFKGNYVIAVKDESKFRQLINDAASMMKTTGLMDLYKNMGMEINYTVTQNVDNYKGISIDSAKMTMKFTDQNTPQAQMLKDMYGDGFDYRWGMVNGLFACSIGGDSSTAIHSLIDKIQSGQTTQIASEIKTAMSLVPDAQNADMFVTMNLLRLFKLGSSFVPLPIPPVDIQSSSNLVIDAKADNGTMTVHIALPKEHVQEIKNTVIKVEQEMSQQ